MLGSGDLAFQSFRAREGRHDDSIVCGDRGKPGLSARGGVRRVQLQEVTPANHAVLKGPRCCWYLLPS